MFTRLKNLYRETLLTAEMVATVLAGVALIVNIFVLIFGVPIFFLCLGLGIGLAGK